MAGMRVILTTGHREPIGIRPGRHKRLICTASTVVYAVIGEITAARCTEDQVLGHWFPGDVLIPALSPRTGRGRSASA